MSLNLISKLPTTKDKSLNEQTNGQINDDNTTKEANWFAGDDFKSVEFISISSNLDKTF